MDIVSSMDNIVISNEEEKSLMRAMHIPSGFFLNMVLKVAIELGLFEIIAKSSQLSSYEIAAHLPTKNPKTPLVLERILRFLASQSFLKCNITKDDGGHIHTSYNLTPLSKSLISSKDGTSVAPFLLLTTDPVFVSSWFHLKDAILEGEIPFNKAHGMHAFEYHEKDSRFNVVFNKAMQNLTCIETKRVLESYFGFEGVKEVIDVGGGLGVLLASIVSKYPNIKGINFDLPHVIQDAPTYAGVEHIGGDMFENVPKGEVIILKAVLHDWDDDHCLKILKNCWRALPKDGKVVMIEQIQQENPESTNLLSKHALSTDILMATMLAGGKERTKQEFETLAKDAGFASMKIVCRAYYCWVMELLKC